jgi:hypothetical protein
MANRPVQREGISSTSSWEIEKIEPLKELAHA